MKRLLVIFLLSALPALQAEAQPGPDVSVNVDFFYSSLSPYGEWLNSDFGYGWRPLHVVHGWRPYLYGRWAWTDYGWYWVSSEPFGWATFHYGRWVYDDYYGWIWIPDRVWGPSWVEWRYDDDYIGWAPLSPYATFSASIGIVYSHHWMAPIHYWNFIPCRYFTTTHVVDYIQPIERSRRIFGNTREGNSIRSDDHRIINGGVDRGFIERRTNSRIERVDVVNNDRTRGDRFIRSDGRNRIESYQPRFDSKGRNEQSRPEIRQESPRNSRSSETDRSQENRMQPSQGRTGREQMQQQDRMQKMREQQIQQNRTRESAGRERQQQMREQPRQQIQERPQQQMRERPQQQLRERPQQQMRERPQQQMRERPQQQMRERPQQQMRQKPQQQMRERPQPSQRQPESRGGREGRRRG